MGEPYDSSLGQFDRLPPHSMDAEMCLLASMMLQEDTIKGVKELVNRGAFFQADHQLIFDAIVHLNENNQPIDAVIVKEELAKRNILEEIGGTAYIAKLLNHVPSAAHAAHYAKIVREKSILRGIISIATDAMRVAYCPEAETDAATTSQDLALKFTELASTGNTAQVHQLADVVVEVLGRKRAGTVLRISTGIKSIDDVIGGLRLGGKTIIGAKAGMGKSLMLKQMARNIAGRGIPFGIISIEEGRHKIGENMLANESGIANNRIAFGSFCKEEWDEANSALNRMSNLPIYIIDSVRKVGSIVSAAHLLVHKHKCQVIAIDHLHVVESDGNQRDNREREMSKISAELKWAWKRLNVAGIEAAQLNRKDGRDRPELSSLRDSGSLEQDGDCVILLHQEDYYRKNHLEHDHILEAIIAKNKDGARGTVGLRYDGARQRITDLPGGPLGEETTDCGF